MTTGDPPTVASEAAVELVTGEGALLGTGLVFLASFAFDALVWLNDDLAAVDRWTFLSWSLAGFGALVAGIAGTVVVARRSRRRPGA